MRRIRLRTLMIIVAICALLMGSVGPGRRWYRRWSYHRSQAVRFGKFEQKERAIEASEINLAADREAIKATLMKTAKFGAMTSEDQGKAIDAAVVSHRWRSKQARAAAAQWEDQRRMSETAALWSWDPFAPDVP
jgi:hypothetical protein